MRLITTVGNYSNEAAWSYLVSVGIVSTFREADFRAMFQFKPSSSSPKDLKNPSSNALHSERAGILH